MLVCEGLGYEAEVRSRAGQRIWSLMVPGWELMVPGWELMVPGWELTLPASSTNINYITA